MASAMIERAELPVHRNRTLKRPFGVAGMAFSRSATGRRFRRGGRGLRHAASRFMRDACRALAAAVVPTHAGTAVKNQFRVVAGLDPAIHLFAKKWARGSSPRVTVGV